MTDMINPDYLPVIYKIPNPENDIFDYDIDPEFSPNIDYPKFSLGFQHYLHQSKDKMEKTKEFEGKKKVFYVINKFERYIDNYDESIGNISKTYFNIINSPDILTRAFYKLWEIFYMFDLIDLDKKNFVSAHLAEGPGSFIQATMFYRDKFATKGASKNDKYHAVTLHSEKKHVPPMEQSFIDYYNKEKPVRFILHKTYPREMARLNPARDNGDITDLKTIQLFGGAFTEKKADFITADGGFDWSDENTQEQESAKLILAQIIMALKIQAKGGNFVCKLYETFTSVGSKYIAILKSFYSEVYMVKPLTSRPSNSEKYAVCINYIEHKSNNEKITILEDLLKMMNNNIDDYLINIFPDYEFDTKFKQTIINLNIKIANRQFVQINEMSAFIDKQNYRGDEYQQRRDLQIVASKYWISKFFPIQKEFDSIKKEIENMTNNLISASEIK